MAAINDTQPRFGRRNRNDDSSSSRESSPVRKHKRSFSPTSDDELVIEPIADDDTPPPEGPLIRQAVAFAIAPASINTYQASPIAAKQHFLPGQEVPTPPPPPKVRKTKKKNAPRYSSQTGRFRIASYDPTPLETPALTSGDGPYASMYRATTAASNGPGAGQAGVEPAMAAPTGSRNKPKPSDSRPKASTSKAKVTASSAKSASKIKVPDSSQGSPSVPVHMALPGPEAAPSRGLYYRRDYEQSKDAAGSSHSVTASSPSPQADIRRLQANRRPNIPLRLVTVLIEDTRGEAPDSQLAEVRVVLRDSEDTARDGYWANAEDVCRTLQASPSRIDGPAKVYAWRGKYRQIILKVTADNQDEWVSANVVVNPDRTLEVVVETGLPPGARMNAQPRREIPEPDPYTSPRAVAQFPYTSPGHGYPTSQEPGTSSRKRRHSPSDDYGDRANNSRQWSPSTLASSPRGTPSLGPSTVYQNSFNAGAPDARIQFPGQHRPASNRHHSPPNYSRGHSRSDSSESDDPDTIHDLVSQEVDELIQQESTWVDYFRWSGNPRRSAAVVLKEYQIVQGFVDRWVGKPVPSGALIEKSHIARALKIEDQNPNERDKYMSECTETLQLMALYGPEGQRLQDAEVVEKAKDDSEPGYQAKPVRALLKLLRRVDQQWVSAHSATQ